MQKEIEFEFEIPQNSKTNKEIEQLKKERIQFLKNAIKIQYEEVYPKQNIEIVEENKKQIEDMIFATQDLIDNCIRDDYYSGNKDEHFVNLIYICHKLDLKMETYKLEEKNKEITQKQKDVEEKQKAMEQKILKSEEQSNNLVYNILGFIASFSIVSAAATAIINVKGTLNIALFMAFCTFILITTLIALNNFYKNRSNDDINPLKNNYFLWWALLILIVVIVAISGMQYLKNSKNKIMTSIEKNIEQDKEDN